MISTIVITAKRQQALASIVVNRGPKGEDGDDGLSAYQLAVQAGFVGTEADWLAALVGEQGLSAYQVALNNGFVGSESDWLQSLMGSDANVTNTNVNSAISTNSSATRTALGLTSMATVTAGTGVLTALQINIGSAGAVVLFGGALGTPSSGTLSNCTGLPISSGVSGLGSGVAAFLATPTSANLASALTDEISAGSSPKALFGDQAVATTSSPTFAALTLSGIASTRIPFATTGGQLTSANGLKWNGNQIDIDGTSNPGFRIFNGGTSTNGFFFYNGAGGVGNFGIYDITAGADRLVIASNGDVRIGSNAANSSSAAFKMVSAGRLLLGGGLSDDGANNLQINGGLRTTGAIKRGSYTVATLPSAATAGAGSTAFVTDSNATISAGLGNTVASGGSNFVPVYSDGTNWKIG